MLIWGTGGATQDYGVATHQKCETCEKDRPFHVLLDYRYFGFYWVFNFITQKKYWLLCEICHRGWSLHPKEVKKQIGGDRIPFMHRYGLVALVGLFVAIGVLNKLYLAVAP